VNHRFLWFVLKSQEDRLLMILMVGRKVRFYEPYRPPQVRWGMTGVVVDVDERPTTLGHESWVRAQFGDFLTPWIEEWQLESVG
jgi:hypothetical protein